MWLFRQLSNPEVMSGQFLYSPRCPLFGAGQRDSRGQCQTGILPEDGISLVVQPAAPELLLEGTGLCLDAVVFPHLLSAGCCGRPPREELQVLHLLLLFWPWHQHRDCIWHETCCSRKAVHINGALGLEWIK